MVDKKPRQAFAMLLEALKISRDQLKQAAQTACQRQVRPLVRPDPFPDSVHASRRILTVRYPCALSGRVPRGPGPPGAARRRCGIRAGGLLLHVKGDDGFGWMPPPRNPRLRASDKQLNNKVCGLSAPPPCACYMARTRVATLTSGCKVGKSRSKKPAESLASPWPPPPPRRSAAATASSSSPCGSSTSAREPRPSQSPSPPAAASTGTA